MKRSTDVFVWGVVGFVGVRIRHSKRRDAGDISAHPRDDQRLFALRFDDPGGSAPHKVK
jgi:hypothetical protein